MRLFIKTTITIIIFSSICLFALAQDVPPPPPAHQQNGNQNPGGNGPVGEGLLILIGLSGLYGAKKAISNKKNKENTDE